MSLPGPGAAQWVVDLVALAAAAGMAGEGVRALLARRWRWFRADEPIERGLLDLFLAGAVLYLLAVLPFGLFRPVVLAAVWTVAAVGGVLLHLGGAAATTLPQRVLPYLRPLASWAYLATIGGALLLFAAELAAAWGVPTGNTFDSSVDATFTALLTYHGQSGLTLQPISPEYTAYPQGPAAWFGAAGVAFGWPAAQVPLLLTPLFLGVAPLSGFALGRRWFGSAQAGAVVAVGLAVLLPGTRYFAYGSNDFVLAFPLVIYLAARSREWFASELPHPSEAAAFGLLLGYSAALNPVGAEWIATTLLVVALARRASAPWPLGRWLARWAFALGCGLVAVVPSLAAFALGPFGTQTTGAAGSRLGISMSQFVGWSDPFLFGAAHPNWAPDVILQAELATLLVIGAALLGLPALRLSEPWAEARRWLGAGVVAALAWQVVSVAAGSGVGWAAPLAAITSAGQMSVLLFTMLGVVALVPLVRAFERAREPSPAPVPREPQRRGAAAHPANAATMALAVAVVVLLPGAVATVLVLPAENHSLYDDFSRVTASDFALLEAAPGLLPPGARVLVAPGSAAEFLPAYQPDLTVLYPMTGAAWTTNASYLALRSALTNGTLGPAGESALSALRVQFIAITGPNTVLYPPFSPAPFLAGAGFPLVWHEGDAYLFADPTGAG